MLIKTDFRRCAPPIGHLKPYMILCPCPDIGRDLTIRVNFLSHCYTEHFDPDQHDRTEIIIRDAGGPRVFCPIRHGLSLRLPGIVARLPDARVYQTAERRNYVYAVPLETEDGLYEMYFMLQRVERRQGTDLRLTVESAYPVNAPTPRPRRPNSIRFVVLARKVFLRQPVRFAPR